jgi:hypothetical protein
VFARGFKTWCENTAIHHRRAIGLQPAEPLTPEALASHLGVAVWRAREVPGVPEHALRVLLEEDPDSWSALTVHAGGRTVIILNSSHRGGRPASDITHELAHVILGHQPARVDVSEDGLLILNTFDRVQEDEANWLAGCLLLPRDALLQIRRNGTALAIAARHYGVSLDMLQYRLSVTGVDYQLAPRRRSQK